MKFIQLLKTMTMCLCMSLALTSCGLRPKEDIKIVIQKAGMPSQILEQKSTQTRTLVGGNVAEQDVGGWFAHPPEHWEVIQRRMELLLNITKELKDKNIQLDALKKD